jgi:hypothetical protein
MLAKVEKLDRLQKVRGACVGCCRAQHRVVVPRDRNDPRLRMILPREVD